MEIASPPYLWNIFRNPRGSDLWNIYDAEIGPNWTRRGPGGDQRTWAGFNQIQLDAN